MSMQPRSPFRIVRSVVFALIIRDMQARLAGSRMGLIKIILEPLLNLTFMLTIFGVLRAGMLPGVDYAVFLLAGIGPFFMFRNIALRVMKAADASKALFAYKQIKPFDVFVARMAVEVILNGCVYFALLLAMGWLELRIAMPDFLAWSWTILLGVLFSLALGMIFAAIVEVVPEFDLFVRIAFMPLYLLSGVLYPVSHIPDAWVPYVAWNPFLHLIELLRADAITGYTAVPWVSELFVFGLTVVMLFGAMGLYRIRRFALASH